jgi:taurine transport system permease protein
MRDDNFLIKGIYWREWADPVFWTIIPFATLLLIWQLVSVAGFFPSLILPSPAAVYDAGIRQWNSGILVGDIIASISRLFLGFVIGASLGMALGILLALNRALFNYADPVVSFFQSIGGIAWVPIAVLWFGFGWGSILFVIANTVFFIVLLNTLSGIETVPQNLVNSVRTLGGNRRTIIFEVLIPGALPSIMNGMRVGMGLGWRALIAAEMIAATNGLGFRIFDAAAYWKSDQILLGLIVIGTLWAITDNLVLRNLERKTVERWGMVGSDG